MTKEKMLKKNKVTAKKGGAGATAEFEREQARFDTEETEKVEDHVEPRLRRRQSLAGGG